MKDDGEKFKGSYRTTGCSAVLLCFLSSSFVKGDETERFLDCGQQLVDMSLVVVGWRLAFVERTCWSVSSFSLKLVHFTNMNIHKNVTAEKQRNNA